MGKLEPPSRPEAGGRSERGCARTEHATGPTPGRIAAWLALLDQRLWATPDESTLGLKLFFKRWLQIIHRSLLAFHQHDATTSASTLTYATLLSLVPLLALLMAGLTVFGVQKSVRETLKHYPLIQNLEISKSPADGAPRADAGATTTTAPLALTAADTTSSTTTPGTSGKPVEMILTGPGLVDRVFDFVDNANLQKLGPLGIIGLLWAVMMLLTKIEVVMNRAWSVHRQRAFARKTADYLHIVIVGTLILLALTTTTSSRVISVLPSIPVLSMVEKLVLGNIAYLIIWPAFVILYAFIPNTNVRWRSAIAGGLVAGTLYQMVQLAFISFSSLLLRRYGTIYGSFAALFVMFFWIYISWMILLWGAEVCAVHQNLRDLRRQRREWTGLPYERETLALRLAALIAAPMLQSDGRRPMDAGDLADALKCPPDPLGEMVELFRRHGLLIQSLDDQTYLLARSPEKVSVLEILRLVRQGSLKNDQEAAAGSLFDLDARILDPLRRKTLGDLAAMPLDEIHALRL